MLIVLSALYPALSWGDVGAPVKALPPSGLQATGAAGTAAPAPFSGVPDSTERLIVKYRDTALAKAPRLDSSHVQALSASAGVALTHVRPMSGNGQVFRLPKRMKIEDAEAIAKRLRADPRVEYAVPDRLLFKTATPNDPQYAAQWHYKSPDAPDNEIAGINLPPAWDITTGSSDLVVAVIDTGIVTHADLQGRVLPGYNFISDPVRAGNGVGRSADASDLGDWVTSDESTNPASPFNGCAAENSSWHGTHVAGTIAAASNNGTGVAGVNWSSKILPVRVLGKCGGYTSDIVDGIRWAAGISVPGVPDNTTPAKVINMSLGGGSPCDDAEQSAINDAIAAGTTVVVAAGNSSSDAAYFSPASCNGVITVAAVNRVGGITYYSNYGQTVKIAAPGGEQFYDGDPNGVLSTFNSGATSPVASPGGDTYHYYQGTSQATPHVAGTVSLMLSAKPSLTPAQVTQILQGTSRDFPMATGSYAGDCMTFYCGAGITDAYQALQAISTNAPVIGAAPLSFIFSAYPGGPNPPSQNLVLSNPGGGTLSWSVSSSSSWLKVSPSSGSNGGTVTVSVDTSLFDGTEAAGGIITISAPGAAKTTVAIPVEISADLALHTSIPTAVAGHAAAAVNGKIYVIGGYGGGSLVQIYNPETDSWTSGAAKPTPATNTGAAVINGKIYVPGGRNTSTGAVSNTLEIYDPAADQWTSGASMPMAMEGTAVTSINGILYLAGGQDDTYTYSAVYAYDPAANQWSSVAHMAYYRSFPSAGVIDGKMYVVGGFHDAASGYTEVYDPVANSWSTVGQLNTSRMEHGSAVLGGKLYAFGGTDASNDYLDDIEVYDPASKAWSEVPQVMNEARAYLNAAAVGSSIYVMGGYDGNSILDINESLDLPQQSPQTPVVTWGAPAAITYGTALSATQLNASADVLGSFVYDPPAGTVLNAGNGQTLSVTFTPTDSNAYVSVKKSVTIDVSKAAATVTLGNLSATYDGTPKPAAATTNPSGLSVSITYNGSSTVPSAVGSYAVVATVSDGNYTGSANGTLVISKAAASVFLNGLSATYDGTPKAVTATTNPLGKSVTVTYNGSSTPPTNVGSYAVAATVNDASYSGSASGTLVISKGIATVTLSGLSATYDGTVKSVAATTAPSGLTVAVTYNGSATAPTAAGSYAVAASINDANYTGSANGTLVIAKAAATVTLGSLSATYDGTAKYATATTAPTGLTVAFTYNNSTSPPMNAGSYAVVGTINDANYSGSASGTLVIAKGTATVTLGGLSATYDGTAKAATATTTPSGKAVTFTYNGSATPPSAAGSYAVVASVSDSNYSGTASGTLTIAKAALTVTADAKSKTAGAADPALTYTYSALAAGDTVSVFSGSLTRAAGETAGTYPITIGTLSAGPNYTVNFVGALFTINAAQPTTYTVSFASGGNGTLTGTASQTVTSGGSTSAVTAVPATGYHFVNWTGTGGFAATANPLTVTNVIANQTITANFSVNTYTVTPSATSNGSMSPSTAQTVNYNATTSFTVTPASGYTIASVGGCGGSLSGSTYTTGPITADCSVTASFSPTVPPSSTVTITPAVTGGGTINPSKPVTGKAPLTKTFTLTPAYGYHIASVDGCGGSLSGNSYTTGAVSANCTISATFEADPISYTWASISAPVALGYKASKATIALSVTATGPVTSATIDASTSDDWITITGDGTNVSLKKGKGSGKITVTAGANTSSIARTGSIVVNGQEVTVTQAGAPCTFSAVTAAPRSLGADGGTVNLQVTTPDGCGWSVIPPASGGGWLTIGDTPASGSGSVSIAADANHGNDATGKYVMAKARKVVITVQNAAGVKKTVTVSQTGD